tara:strand:- start:835 stop:1221 length:387 start_codon:yes stop_codon:yes gene_type:complete
MEFESSMINRTMSQTRLNELFILGIEHFNKGLFYEAHEFWEEIWHTRHGSEKAFFQALILLAGVGVHYQKKRFGPADRLLRLAAIRLKESEESISNYFDPRLLTTIHEHLQNSGIEGIPELKTINPLV